MTTPELRLLQRKAIGHCKDRRRQMTATIGQIPEANDHPGIRWAAINMENGVVVQLPGFPRFDIPECPRHVAFVAWSEAHGVTFFLHPEVIGHRLLAKDATLTVIDRTALAIHRYTKPEAQVRTAMLFGVNIFELHEARLRLVEHGYLGVRGRPTRKGHRALRPYWNLLCLPWA